MVSGIVCGGGIGASELGRRDFSRTMCSSAGMVRDLDWEGFFAVMQDHVVRNRTSGMTPKANRSNLESVGPFT